MAKKIVVVAGARYRCSVGEQYVKINRTDGNDKPIGKPHVVGIVEVLGITNINLERLRWKNPYDADLMVTGAKLVKYIRKEQL